MGSDASGSRRRKIGWGWCGERHQRLNIRLGAARIYGPGITPGLTLIRALRLFVTSLTGKPASILFPFVNKGPILKSEVTTRQSRVGIWKAILLGAGLIIFVALA
jgi:hypothetical protein